ncbi:MAG: cyclic nucleotide-binding domain-containing protein [Elainellaceae cyanobacterium]
MSDVLLSELTSLDIDWLVSVGQSIVMEPNQSISIGAQQASRSLANTGTNAITNTVSADAQTLYLILDGEISSLKSESGIPITLSSGDVLGSEPLLNLPAPSAHYQTTAPSRLMAVPISALTRKVQQDREFSAHIYRAIALLFSEQLRKLYATSAPWLRRNSGAARDALNVFGELRDSDLDWLVSAGKIQKFGPKDFLLQAGRPVDALHIILDGEFSLALLEGDINPLVVSFNCPIETAATMTVVNTLTKGEIAGAIAFLDSRPLPVTIRALRDSLVLSIPRLTFTLKLQQDLGFATRFYRILGTQLAGMVSNALEDSGDAGQAVAASGLGDEIEFGDELDLDSLQKMSNGANRFNWMLSRLGVSGAVMS